MDEDEVPPLRQSDNDSVATSTGAARPTLQFRSTGSGLKKSQTEPPLRRVRSRQVRHCSVYRSHGIRMLTLSVVLAYLDRQSVPPSHLRRPS